MTRSGQNFRAIIANTTPASRFALASGRGEVELRDIGSTP